MKEYVSAFHPRLVGLTGTPEEIAGVAKRYGVWAAKEERPEVTEYNVNHSRIALLFGPQGEPIAILPHEEGADAIAAEIKRWVR
jgi:protein SCO1/2